MKQEKQSLTSINVDLTRSLKNAHDCVGNTEENQKRIVCNLLIILLQNNDFIFKTFNLTSYTYSIFILCVLLLCQEHMRMGHAMIEEAFQEKIDELEAEKLSAENQLQKCLDKKTIVSNERTQGHS